MKQFTKYLACVAIIFTVGCTGTTGSNSPKDIITNFQTGVTPKNIEGTYEVTGKVESSNCSGELVSDTSEPIEITLDQSGSTLTMAEETNTYSATAVEEQVEETADNSSSSSGAEVASTSKSTKTPTSGIVSGDSFKIETSSTVTYNNCSFTASTVLVGTVDGSGNITGAFEGSITNVSGDCAPLGIQECSALLSLSGEKTSSTSSGSSTDYVEPPTPTQDSNSNDDTPSSTAAAEKQVNIETAAPLKSGTMFLKLKK